MNLNEYDKWVTGNQKKILDWTRKFSKARYAPIRDAFSAYRNAKSNKEKIKAFEALKKELKTKSGTSFGEIVEKKYNPVKEVLQRAANDHTQGDIEALDRNSNLSDKLSIYDDLSPLSEAMTTLPKVVDNYDWVELDKAYQDAYNYKEMKALADKYNYDYTDPKERAEFLKLLADMENKRLKDEAYSPKDARGMITQIAYPVTMEHARKTDEISPVAVLTDLASQGFMAGGEGVGSMIAGKPGSIAGGMLTAPAITELGQHFINDKPATDALADYGVGVGTNAFAPGAIKGMFSSFDVPFKWGEKGAARQAANKYADELENIIRKQRTGTPYRNLDNVHFRTQEIYEKKLADAKANNVAFDPTKAMKESEEEALRELIDREKATLYSTGHTNVYKNRLFRKPKELTPEQVNNNEHNILNIRDTDRAKEQLFFKWKRPETAEIYKRLLAAKKINNEPWTPGDLVTAGVTETPIHAIGRNIGRYGEPLTSLGMNLGATTRATDRKMGMFDRYLNLPWKYGTKEEKKIDFNKPDVQAYMKAYGRFKGSPEYFKEPPKLKGYSEEEMKQIQDIAERISIKDIFGE